MDMKTLSVCMIVRDAANYIEKSLASVFDIAEEIIIVDTGSQDNTLELAKRFNPKVYHFKWNDDFSEARNFSLLHARGDYILALDADEVIYPEDAQKLAEVINSTDADGISLIFHNLTTENSENLYTIHVGMRLFKNGCFKYLGKIHEQPVFTVKDRNPKLVTSSVRVKHYGYLPSNSGKKKRTRNMSILEKILEENPEDNFNLFNMGNEYMCLNDFETAQKYYQRIDIEKNVRLAYMPHMFYRYAICLYNLHRNREGLALVSKGLEYYSTCTDLEFLRGVILKNMKRFTLALDSFNKCIEMGESPPELSFSTDTADFKPLVEKAEIYYMLEDYAKALDCYLQALGMKQQKYYLVYNICEILSRILKPDGEQIYKNLCGLFANCENRVNTVVITDALLNENLVEQAEKALGKFIEANIGNDVDNGTGEILDTDICFLQGRLLFCRKNYKDAFNAFANCIDPQVPKGILGNVLNHAHEYMLVCSLVSGETDLQEKFLKILSGIEKADGEAVYAALLRQYDFNRDGMIDGGALERTKSILQKILYTGEYDIFERALNILNLIDSKEVLTALAEIYHKLGFRQMAVKTVLRSIKELDYVDSTSAEILYSEL